MLPDWLEPGTLRTVALVAVVVLAVVAIWLVRLVKRTIVRVLVLGVALGLGLGVWAQRVELGDCTDSCECRVFGWEVELPDRARDRCGADDDPSGDEPTG